MTVASLLQEPHDSRSFAISFSRVGSIGNRECRESINAIALCWEALPQRYREAMQVTIPPQIWFTADHHFGHDNIRRFCHRPFESVTAMNEALVARWNERVGEEDCVYHLGDLFLTSLPEAVALRRRLNGRIHLIRGNHDRTTERLAREMPDAFVWIRDYHEINVVDPQVSGGKRLIVLSHYAFRVWRSSHYGSWHLYGHSHGSLASLGASMDVGVDCHDFYPLNYSEIGQRLKTILAEDGAQEDALPTASAKAGSHDPEKDRG